MPKRENYPQPQTRKDHGLDSGESYQHEIMILNPGLFVMRGRRLGPIQAAFT